MEPLSLTPKQIDLSAAPRIVLIGADGKRVADDATDFTAVFLPDYYEHGLLYDFRFAGKPLPWKQALAAAKKCDLFGETDWQASSAKEEEVLIDRSVFGPATWPQLRAKTPSSGWVWTRDVDPSSPSVYAFGVYLYDGSVRCYDQYDDGLCRPVRRVSARQSLGFLA